MPFGPSSLDHERYVIHRYGDKIFNKKIVQGFIRKLNRDFFPVYKSIQKIQKIVQGFIRKLNRDFFPVYKSIHKSTKNNQRFIRKLNRDF